MAKVWEEEAVRLIEWVPQRRVRRAIDNLKRSHNTIKEWMEEDTDNGG